MTCEKLEAFKAKYGVTIEHGYKCFHKGKTCEVYAETSYAAAKAAAAKFGSKGTAGITVVLCEKAGAAVAHSTVEFG